MQVKVSYLVTSYHGDLALGSALYRCMIQWWFWIKTEKSKQTKQINGKETDLHFHLHFHFELIFLVSKLMSRHATQGKKINLNQNKPFVHNPINPVFNQQHIPMQLEKALLGKNFFFFFRLQKIFLQIESGKKSDLNCLSEHRLRRWRNPFSTTTMYTH